MNFPFLAFDLDGTLLDTLPDIRQALNTVMEEAGFAPFDSREVRAMVGNGLGELVRKALARRGAGADDVLARDRETRIRTLYAEKPWRDTLPYPGIPELLTRLKLAGIPMAVVTNKAQPVADLVVEHFFPGIFDVVQGEVPGQPRKPDPAPLLRALEQLAGRTPGSIAPGRAPEGCLMIGDSDVDVATAVAAGVPCIAVLWGFRDRPELEAAGARIFTSDTESLELLLTGTAIPGTASGTGKD